MASLLLLIPSLNPLFLDKKQLLYPGSRNGVLSYSVDRGASLDESSRFLLSGSANSKQLAQLSEDGAPVCNASGKKGKLSVYNDTAYLAYVALYRPGSKEPFWKEEVSAGHKVKTSFDVPDEWGVSFKYAGYPYRQISCINAATSLRFSWESSQLFWEASISSLSRLIPKRTGAGPYG